MKVYIVLMYDASYGLTNIVGVYKKKEDAERKFDEMRERSIMAKNRYLQVKEGVDITKPLQREDCEGQLQIFMDEQHKFTFYDWNGNGYELSVNDKNVL